jgi:hypothetical protein
MAAKSMPALLAAVCVFVAEGVIGALGIGEFLANFTPQSCPFAVPID